MSPSGEPSMFLDPEKGTNAAQSALDSPIESFGDDGKNGLQDAAKNTVELPLSNNKFLKWTRKIEHKLGFEARGIYRVQSAEQTKETTLGFMQIAVMWISINTAAQNITLASIGAGVFGLGFLDAALCSVLGAIVSTLSIKTRFPF